MEDRKYFNDAELEAKLNSLRKDDPNIRCPQDHMVVKLCINPKCHRSSLRCSDDNCKSCGRDSHPTCINLPFEEFLFLIN